LRILLTALDAASNPQQMDGSGWGFHALAGSSKGHWAVSVNGNWRITFTFRGEDAEIVNYLDCH
jgi:proteic killer suppression protein